MKRLKEIKRKEYFVKVLINEGFMNKIRNSLKNTRGKTIQQIINETKLARGTIKLYLSALVHNKEVTEISYNQNTKVYFWGEFQRWNN